jgi:predicted metal-dependent hydrolase
MNLMDEVDIAGKTYDIVLIRTRYRHASSRLKGNQIIVKIPYGWPSDDVDKTFQELSSKAIKNIERGRWRERDMKEINFTYGQEVEVLGRRFRITDPGNPKKLVKGISKAVMPNLIDRIQNYNKAYFNAQLSEIKVKDVSSTWGSYHTDGKLHLNFRLLFAPEKILDYVIVHELAHSRYKSHGVRFWGEVEKVIPDHKERRKWLRENGSELGP